jgi:hypothetical protein
MDDGSVRLLFLVHHPKECYCYMDYGWTTGAFVNNSSSITHRIADTWMDEGSICPFSLIYKPRMCRYGSDDALVDDDIIRLCVSRRRGLYAKLLFKI